MSDSYPRLDGDHGDCIHCLCIHHTKALDKDNGLYNCQNHLQNWGKWIEERKKVHKHLTRSLGRSAGELLMNAGEERRGVEEDKRVFEYSRITTTFDKLRGNPEFWKLPAGLSNSCDRSLDPIYFTVKSKEEKNEIPAIEYVGTPQYILNEKNILPRTRNFFKLWQNGDYRNRQFKKWSSKICLIEPHRPECANLIVLGEKITSPKLKEEEESQRSLSSFDEFTRYSYPYSFHVNVIPKISFLINGSKFSSGDQLLNDTVKIRLIYECTTNISIPLVKKLRLENKGVTTLRFSWNRIEKFRLFRDITRNRRAESCSFYFDKNELLLFPGKTLEFPIWFKPKEVGNYLELWEITTIPKIWDQDYQVIIILQGFVSPYKFGAKSKAIEYNLNRNVKDTLIKDLLNSIFNSLKYTETSPQTLNFTEEQLFESANQEIWGVEKLPKYVYNVVAVKALKEFYQTVKQPDSPDFWNYSIRDLKVLTKKKDIVIYVEKKTKEAQKARERRLELLAILREQAANAGKPQKKPPAKPNVKNALALPQKPEADQIETNEKYSELENILQRLEKPAMIVNKDREKHFVAYTVLQTYFVKMCEALETQDGRGFVNRQDFCPSYDYNKVSSIDQFPERLIFEKFDDIWMYRTKRVPPDHRVEFQAQPKPDILKDIPLENSVLLYRTYFKIPDTDPKGKKGAGKPGKGDKKSKESKSKDSKSKDSKGSKDKKGEKKVKEIPRVVTVKAGFDPYSEEYIPVKFDIVKEKSSSSTIDDSNKIENINENDSVNQTANNNRPQYDYEKYLIVYTHLSDAICAMVDALETFKVNALSVGVVGELAKCSKIETLEKPAVDSEQLETIEVLEVEEQTEEEIVEPELSSQKLEDDSYFQYLLDSHLKRNICTKKYILEGKTKYAEEDDFSSSIAEEVEEPEPVLNVFRSHETIVESVYSFGLDSVGVQTSIQREDDNSASGSIINEPSASSLEQSVFESLSHDIFYFLGKGDYDEESEKCEYEV